METTSSRGGHIEIEIIALYSLVIYEQRADGHRRYVKVFRYILLTFYRIITFEHILHGVEWTQQFSGE